MFNRTSLFCCLVVIDRKEDPTADTGLFELAYKQQCPRPPTYLGLQLTIRGKRMSRQKIFKNARPIENVNIIHENFERLSISPSVQDYQGPIIGDFIEELKEESKTMLKACDSEKIPIHRRKKMLSCVRKNRTVHHIQPTINTITMKSKSFIQYPFSFNSTRKNILKRSMSSKPQETSNVQKLNCSEATDSKKSIKINRYMSSKSINGGHCSNTKSILTKKDLEINTKTTDDLLKTVKKPTCPRLIRSMYDHTHLSKSLLNNFLTVGLDFDSKGVINPLRVSGTAATRPNSKIKA